LGVKTIFENVVLIFWRLLYTWTLKRIWKPGTTTSIHKRWRKIAYKYGKHLQGRWERIVGIVGMVRMVRMLGDERAACDCQVVVRMGGEDKRSTADWTCLDVYVIYAAVYVQWSLYNSKHQLRCKTTITIYWLFLLSYFLIPTSILNV